MMGVLKKKTQVDPQAELWDPCFKFASEKQISSYP